MFFQKSVVSSHGEMLTIHGIGMGSDPHVIRLGGGGYLIFHKSCKLRITTF
jgi:hypothetical protein